LASGPGGRLFRHCAGTACVGGGRRVLC